MLAQTWHTVLTANEAMIWWPRDSLGGRSRRPSHPFVHALPTPSNHPSNQTAPISRLCSIVTSGSPESATLSPMQTRLRWRSSVCGFMWPGEGRCESRSRMSTPRGTKCIWVVYKARHTASSSSSGARRWMARSSVRSVTVCNAAGLVICPPPELHCNTSE
jgi:hypothetical protein